MAGEGIDVCLLAGPCRSTRLLSRRAFRLGALAGLTEELGQGRGVWFVSFALFLQAW